METAIADGSKYWLTNKLKKKNPMVEAVRE